MEPTEVEIARRTALGALLGLVLAGCSSSAGTQSSTLTPTSSPVSSPLSSTPATTPATTSATSAASPTYVPGSNAAITQDVLASNAAAYNGRWRGAWTESASGARGTISGTVTIKPAARTFSSTVAMTSDLLPGQPLPPFTVAMSVDAYAYDGQTGVFQVVVDTGIGQAKVTSDKGLGSGTFKAELTNIPGHTDVARIDATGTAFRPDLIPVDFTVTFTDGHTVSGHLAFTPGAR